MNLSAIYLARLMIASKRTTTFIVVIPVVIMLGYVGDIRRPAIQ
jgi:hypothetical protein